MSRYLLVLLAWLILLSGSLSSAAIVDVIAGPYNGSFIYGGLGLKIALKPEENVLRGNQSWSIYCWVKSDSRPVAAETLLAGFGEPTGATGTQRYFAVRAGKISFRSGNIEVLTDIPLPSGQWKFLTATYEEGNLLLYVDGVKSASGKLNLLAAAPVVHLAPVALPSTNATHFAGKIADFALVSRALTPRNSSVDGAGKKTGRDDIRGGVKNVACPDQRTRRPTRPTGSRDLAAISRRIVKAIREV